MKAISDAVGEKLEIILDGGVRRGTHVLKAIAAGAKACSFGKMFLFALGAGGQKGVEKVLQNMRDEIYRNMILMGSKNLKELKSRNLVNEGLVDSLDIVTLSILIKKKYNVDLKINSQKSINDFQSFDSILNKILQKTKA